MFFLVLSGLCVIIIFDDISLKVFFVVKFKIGLVFGGGVGCGWVYIGVICVFEVVGIKLDVVVGMFIGVLVGGVYLVGYLDIFEDWVCSLNWWWMFGYFDFIFGVVGGFLGGVCFEKFMYKYFGDMKFEELDIKFVLVIVELVIVYEIWIDIGFFVEGIKVFYVFFGVFFLLCYND